MTDQQEQQKQHRLGQRHQRFWRRAAALVAPPPQASSRRRAKAPLATCLAAAACSALLLLLSPSPIAAAAETPLPDNSPAGFPQSEAVQQTRAVVERQWRAHMSRVSALSTGGARPRSVGDLLGPVLTEWEYALPLPQVRKSLVYAGGANARLRRVVHDLLVGAGSGGDGKKRPTIKVGAIGGSITHGAKASRMGENDWFSLVGSYMRAAFPNADVVTRNGALPATPSALMNMCLETYVDEDADLVFVEYAANDGPDRYDEVKPKVYERLVRKIMQKRRKPAVVMLQLMPKGMAFGPGNREKAPFAATLEDMYGSLAQYYDAPWLSFRNAAWRLGEFHHYGYNWTDLMWTSDFMHPIDHGMRAIADMAVNLLQTTALGLVVDPLGPSDRELLAEPLPPPAHPGNWEARNLMCVYGEAFAESVDLSSSKGFDLVNEGGNVKKPKWGFVATQPGSELVVRLNTTRTSRARDGDQRMNVMLAYLKSYEHMGAARVSCASGCICDPPEQEVDAHHDIRTSTVYLARVLASESDACVIRVVVLPRSSSPGQEHKFKVSGVMMNEYTGADVTTKVHEEQWLGDLQATSSEGAHHPKEDGAGGDGGGAGAGVEGGGGGGGGGGGAMRAEADDDEFDRR